MRIMNLKCPSCNGNLTYDPKKPLSFCQYCGTPLFFDEETKRIEIHHSYDIHTKHEEITEDRTKSEQYISLLTGVGLIGALALIIFMLYIAAKAHGWI